MDQGEAEPGRAMTEFGAATRSQSIQALRRAGRVRRARSALKRQVADAQLAPAEVNLTCPSDITRMPIAQLLASQPGWGEVRTRALLAQVTLREDRSIGR